MNYEEEFKKFLNSPKTQKIFDILVDFFKLDYPTPPTPKLKEMNGMETHKKWWIKFIKTEPRYIPSISPRELTKMGWRAALKTLKKECHCAGMYGEKGSCGLVDWINEELEEN